MTMKTKESERLPLEMTEGKKKNYAGSFVGFMGAVRFFGTREGHEHRWLREVRDEEKRRSGRERE